MPTTITLTPQDARDILDEAPDTGWTIVCDEQIDSRRWVSVHELIIERDGIYYRAYYEQGLTEMQDLMPFEGIGSGAGVTFTRVERRTRLVEVVEYVTAGEDA